MPRQALVRVPDESVAQSLGGSVPVAPPAVGDRADDIGGVHDEESSHGVTLAHGGPSPGQAPDRSGLRQT
ncbi:hypothetical protein GCM10010449_70780 [Streptomyces rectiviolaceus]|uniref:Uncharacterized protein n=1 Tax=Streptomyces rectiviolaceus TaxID=332591 RepID=A0ABP6N9M4_9ACTN